MDDHSYATKSRTEYPADCTVCVGVMSLEAAKVTLQLTDTQTPTNTRAALRAQVHLPKTAVPVLFFFSPEAPLTLDDKISAAELWKLYPGVKYHRL